MTRAGTPQFDGAGLLLRPALPAELGAYAWSTALASLSWDGDTTWSGRYSCGSRASLERVAVAADMSLAAQPGACVVLEVSAGDGAPAARASGVAGRDVVRVQVSATVVRSAPGKASFAAASASIITFAVRIDATANCST